MKSFWWLLFLFTAFISQDETTVEVYRVEKEDRIELLSHNTNIYPVTLELNAKVQNLNPNKALPLLDVIPPESEKKLLSLAYTNLQEGWNLSTKYRYYMGNVFAEHQHSFAYRLPFAKGETFQVAQGFGGSFSHQGDLQHAIDINMPEGSPVYAARGGVVVKLEEDNDQGGPSEEMMEFANYVTIMHDDGTFADYSHLMLNGATAQVGQEVRTGQLIGYSGNTGFSTGPHLHFVVKKTKRGGGFISIPVKFATKEGIQLLEEGEDYIGY